MMHPNTFGKKLSLTTFGESHSLAIGGVIDGFPPDIAIDFDLIHNDVKRRSTDRNAFDSKRKEKDEVVFLSGIFEGKSLGTPIAFIIYNTDAKSSDYDDLKHILRPSHADYTYLKKYGFRDHRGGGRASARETLNWVVAGAFAKMLLIKNKIIVTAYVNQIGNVAVNKEYTAFNLSNSLTPPLYCPDKKATQQMLHILNEAQENGDTLGGVITCVIKNCPEGLGDPVFEKLQAQLAKAMLSINAVKGFEYGSGFKGAAMNGSALNDVFISENNRIKTKTNHSGGIQGGISNGNDIYFKLAFKPVSSIRTTQETVDINGKDATIHIKGRHDVCPVPRALPIVEAMAALVIADNLL